jgi:hypothetical protein
MAALISTLLLIAAPPSVALAESPSPRVPGAGHGIQAQASLSIVRAETTETDAVP